MDSGRSSERMRERKLKAAPSQEKKVVHKPNYKYRSNHM